MITTNSYIFLLKEESKFKKDKDGNSVLDLTINVLDFLRKIFDVEVEDVTLGELEDNPKELDIILEKMTRKFKSGILRFNLEKKEQIVKFKLSGADSTEYLDIVIEGEDKTDAIKIMEYIHNQIVGEKNIFEDYFITIISYDSISEYYCNLIYPRLNEFERKFRKLLFIIYTAQFKKLYFEVTVSEELKTKVKENLQSKGGKNKKNEMLLKQCMYSLDFGTMRQLLFEKKWLPYDEEKLNKYLKQNKDLTKLSDTELREKMLSIKPTNDWERLFFNKDLDKEFENVINEIGKLRNSVAHNKLFNKEQYKKLSELLEKNNKDIDNAILITETEDFKRINKEKTEEAMEQLRQTMNAFANKISNFTKNLIPKVSMGEILKNIIPKFSISEIIKESLEHEEIDLEEDIINSDISNDDPLE